ncbi:hypothetical protein T484DRAFT_1885002 [Baffinella frigidus]|nr:hypothetical protein T484DRAFT_1885002 [Cryptophyta sp. CCMP2293]
MGALEPRDHLVTTSLLSWQVESLPAACAASALGFLTHALAVSRNTSSDDANAALASLVTKVEQGFSSVLLETSAGLIEGLTSLSSSNTSSTSITRNNYGDRGWAAASLADQDHLFGSPVSYEMPVGFEGEAGLDFLRPVDVGPLVTLCISQNGHTVPVSSLSAPVRISIPFTSAFRAAGGVGRCVYVNGSALSSWGVTTIADGDLGVTCLTTHFSSFTIIPADPVSTTPTAASATTAAAAAPTGAEATTAAEAEQGEGAEETLTTAPPAGGAEEVATGNSTAVLGDGAALDATPAPAVGAVATPTPAVPSAGPSAPQAAAVTTYVEMVVSLPLSLSEFTFEKQVNFRAGVASAAGVALAKVEITAVREVTSRRSASRRLLATSVEVDFRVAASDAAAGASLAEKLDAESLNKALKTQARRPARKGLPEATVLKSASVVSDGKAVSNIDVPAIIGGVVGGLVGLSLLVALFALYTNRKQQQARKMSQFGSAPSIASPLPFPSTDQDAEAAGVLRPPQYTPEHAYNSDLGDLASHVVFADIVTPLVPPPAARAAGPSSELNLAPSASSPPAPELLAPEWALLGPTTPPVAVAGLPGSVPSPLLPPPMAGSPFLARSPVAGASSGRGQQQMLRSPMEASRPGTYLPQQQQQQRGVRQWAPDVRPGAASSMVFPVDPTSTTVVFGTVVYRPEGGGVVYLPQPPANPQAAIQGAAGLQVYPAGYQPTRRVSPPAERVVHRDAGSAEGPFLSNRAASPFTPAGASPFAEGPRIYYRATSP